MVTSLVKKLVDGKKIKKKFFDLISFLYLSKMKKNKKEKLPPTKEELIANDPLWEKVFKLRLSGHHKEAEDLKMEILSHYQ